MRLPAIEIPARSLPVYPTQIYSSLDALLLTLLLLAYDPFRRRDGELFALMLSVYAMTRFLIEILRTDEAADLRHGDEHRAEHQPPDLDPHGGILALSAAAAEGIGALWKAAASGRGKLAG